MKFFFLINYQFHRNFKNFLFFLTNKDILKLKFIVWFKTYNERYNQYINKIYKIFNTITEHRK